MPSNGKVGPPGSPNLANFGQRLGLATNGEALLSAWTDSRRGTLADHKQDVFFEGPGGAAAPRRCLPSRLRVGSSGIGRIRVGRRPTSIVRRVGAPVARARHQFRYCVTGGGSVRVAFRARGGAMLVATTARGHRARRLAARLRLRAVRRAYPRAYRIRGGLYATRRSGRVVFGVRRGRVRFVAVVHSWLAKSPRLLGRYLRRAGL